MTTARINGKDYEIEPEKEEEEDSEVLEYRRLQRLDASPDANIKKLRELLPALEEDVADAMMEALPVEIVKLLCTAVRKAHLHEYSKGYKDGALSTSDFGGCAE